MNRIRPRAFQCGSMGEAQRASSRWGSACVTLPRECMDHVVYSRQGFKLMGQQGNAGRCVCESSFGGDIVDTGLSWQEAQGSPLRVVLGDGFNVDLDLKETWSISGKGQKTYLMAQKVQGGVAVIVLPILKHAFP